jgi:hypothetical protein
LALNTTLNKYNQPLIPAAHELFLFDLSEDNGDKVESNEPDYDEDQLEEEEQEEQTGEITINQVF